MLATGQHVVPEGGAAAVAALAVGICRARRRRLGRPRPDPGSEERCGAAASEGLLPEGLVREEAKRNLGPYPCAPLLRGGRLRSRKPDIWRFRWSVEDRLVAVTTPDGNLWRYLYDPLGRRIGKQRLAPEGTTVLERVDFTWDGPTLCEQVTYAPALPHPVSVTWDYHDMRPVAQVERILAGDTPQSEINERFFSIVTDLVGTPSELIDEQGQSRGGLVPLCGARPRGQPPVPRAFRCASRASTSTRRRVSTKIFTATTTPRRHDTSVLIRSAWPRRQTPAPTFIIPILGQIL